MNVPDEYDTQFELQFADPKLAALKITLRRSYGLMASAGQLAGIDVDAVRAGQARPEDLARLDALVDDVAGALVSWSIKDDDGQPLATDRHTVRGLDVVLVLALVDTVLGALQGMSEQATQQLQEHAKTADVDEASLPMNPLG